VIDSEKIESLFKEGLRFYRAGEYFEAHESWEDLWSDYYLPDRKFVQGLIQLSVSFVHLENGNIKGAKSLLNKCTEKFKEFDGLQRGVDVNNLLIQINQVRDAYDSLILGETFDWKIIPKI
jgi:predicted metal-dependent hydrolase